MDKNMETDMEAGVMQGLIGFRGYGLGFRADLKIVLALIGTSPP